MHFKIRTNNIVTALLLFSFSVLVSALALSEVINRMVAAVNEDIVTLYDLRIAALWNGESYDDLPSEEKRKVVNQLINRLLVYQEIIKTGKIVLDSGEVDENVSIIKNAKPHKYFSDAEIREHVKKQLLIRKFAYQRFGSLVRVNEEMIRKYYIENFREDDEKESVLTPIIPKDVYERIKNILTEKEVNRLLSEWLEKQREASTIIISDNL